MVDVQQKKKKKETGKEKEAPKSLNEILKFAELPSVTMEAPKNTV